MIKFHENYIKEMSKNKTVSLSTKLDKLFI